MILTLFETLIAVASAAAGAWIAATAPVSHRNLCALISFAAGTFLAAALAHIVPEALHLLSPAPVAVALLSGYLLFYLISRYVFHVCPACAASHFDHPEHDLRKTAFLMVIALSVHIILDGTAIAAGHALGARTAFSILLIITIHKFPEGLALCALLLKAGFQKTKALVLTVAIEGLTLAGWVLGALLSKNPGAAGFSTWLLVHIGGGFIYLALHAAINESKEHSPRFVLFFFLLGVALVSLTHLMPE